VIDKAKLAGAEMQAEIARLKRDLSVAQQRVLDVQQNNTKLHQDNEDLSQKLHSRAKREGESTVLLDRLADMRAQLRDSERQRDSQQAELTELKTDLQILQDKQAELNGTAVEDSEQVQALQLELDELRQKSRKELTDLQHELDEALSKAESGGQNDQHVLEIEALRQKNEGLEQSLSDRLKELQTSQETGQLLEDELEDANREIDELRRQQEKLSEKISQLEQQAGRPVSFAGTAETDQSAQAGGLNSPMVQIAIAGVAGFVLGLIIMAMLGSGDSSSQVEKGGSASGQIIRR